MTKSGTENFDLGRVTLRLATLSDHPVVQALFREGLLEGHVGGGDTGADIEKLQEAYFSDDGQSALWVADYASEVIGMVGVQ